jgi:high-affinity nickel-transport protein
MSVLVAFVIGGVEFLQVISSELSWTGDLWVWLNALDFETLGFGIVALFLIAWLVSIVYYWHKGFESEYDGQLDECTYSPEV